ncbi:uncharacterized protein [Palaemon carinicauda]|uniref:uncharacterized protein n=1 Tax=Palaemon carinicauda TaxID=392227 RepID=UPI0035B5CCE3
MEGRGGVEGGRSESPSRVTNVTSREKVLTQRQLFDIFAFMKRTTYGISCPRQLLEKFREKQRDFHLMYIDLEKAYDRVTREELWRCLTEEMVPYKYVRLIKEMYQEVYTRVRNTVGVTEGCEMRVRIHQ